MRIDEWMIYAAAAVTVVGWAAGLVAHAGREVRRINRQADERVGRSHEDLAVRRGEGPDPNSPKPPRRKSAR